MSGSSAPEVVALLRAATDALASVDPAQLADPSLFAGLAELYDVETIVRAAQTRWLAFADARDTTVAVAGRSTRSWLVEECNLTSRDAAARLRLARTLGGFPAVEAAFTAARLTADQTAAVVATLLDAPADARDTMESLLLERAATLSPFGLARVSEQLLAEIDAETAKDRAEAARQRRLAKRGVDLDATFEGTGSLSGTLMPEVHDAVKAALDAIDPPSARGSEDARTPRQRRHDALGALARYFLDSAATLPAANGERPRVVVTINAADLVSESAGGAAGGGWATSDSGLPVAPDAVRRLACDAQLLPVVLDEGGDVLRLGRTTRIWSPAIRRAAWIRDHGRCAFPRCRRPPVDLHHLTWWSHGGRTDFDNAAWLCAFHHWLVHDNRWTVRRDTQRTYVFTAPDGREIGHPPRQPRAA
jgi:hypothetical protein